MKKITLVLLIIFTMLLFTGCTKTMDLSSPSNFELSGLNGEGNLNVNMNSDIYWNALKEDKVVTDDDYFVYENTFDVESKTYLKVRRASNLLDSIYIFADKTEGLSNGDAVNLSLEYDQELAKELGYELVLTESTYTIEGLEEPMVLTLEDMFKNVEVRFKGISPLITADIINTHKEEPYTDLNFSIKENQVLRSGGAVEIVPTYDKDYFKSLGYVVEEGTKTYTLGEFNRYVESFQEIPKETLDKLLDATHDKMLSLITDDCTVNENGESDVNGQYLRAGDNTLIENIKVSNFLFLKASDDTITHAKKGIKQFNTLFIIYDVDLKNVTPWVKSEWGVSYSPDRSEGSGVDLKNVKIYATYPNLLLQKDGLIKLDISDIRVEDSLEINYDYIKDYVTENNLAYEVSEHKYSE